MCVEFSFFHDLSTSVWRSGRNGRLMEEGRTKLTRNRSSSALRGTSCASQVQPGHGAGHYIQQFLICGVDGRSQRMGFLIQQIAPASNKDWKNKIPFSNSSASSTCEPHDLSLHVTGGSSKTQSTGCRLQMLVPHHSRRGPSVSRASILWTCHIKRIQTPRALPSKQCKDHGCLQVS